MPVSTLSALLSPSLLSVSCATSGQGERSPAPSCHFAGSEGGYRIAVFDLMGESLSDLFYRCGRRFSLKTVLMLGQQLVTRLEEVHEAGIVHRDVKPGNFVMGQGAESGTVFVIDFGLSNYWRSNSGHIPFNMESPFRGTHRYASVNSHRKFEQSRRDDLEAIAYVLIYFINGGLPWQSLRVTRNKRRKAIGHSKATISPETLCEGLPRQFSEFLKYVKALRFDQTPNYEYCRNLFRNCFDEAALEDDGVWDWELPTAAPRVALNANGVPMSSPLHTQMSGTNAGTASALYAHPSLAMASNTPYHLSGASLSTPHLPHTHGTDMARAVMHHPIAGSIRSPSAMPMSRSHPSNAMNASSTVSPNRQSTSPNGHMTRSPIAHTGTTVPRACVNLASSMPMSNVGRMSHLRSASTPYVSESMTGFGPHSPSANGPAGAPTYASMLRSSNGSPMPADSIAYLDYCNSQTQHSSQSLSNSSYMQQHPSNTASTSTGSLASSSPNHHAADGRRASRGRLDATAFYGDAQGAVGGMMPSRGSHASSRAHMGSNNKNASHLMNLQSDGMLSAWNTGSSSAGSTAHHSTSSPMLGGAYESAAAASNAGGYGSNFVSTHLLQLNNGNATVHSPSSGPYGNHHHMSVTVPSSPTNSLLLNGPSSPLLLHEPSPSPLMHLSSLLDEDALFSTNSLPAFSTASSSSASSSGGSVLFSRGLLTSSSSTVTAPIPMHGSGTDSASVVNGLGVASPILATPDSPSSSTRPDSPLQLDASTGTLWVASPAITEGISSAHHLHNLHQNQLQYNGVGCDEEEHEEDDMVVSGPFMTHHHHMPIPHHMHHHHHHRHLPAHHIISIDDAFPSDVAPALVCVEQPAANMKKRSRTQGLPNTSNAMCSTVLPEPIGKRRSARLIERDFNAVPRTGTLQY